SPPSSAPSPLRSDLDERVAEAEEEEEGGALVVRRPVKEFAEEGGVVDTGDSDGEGGGGWASSSSKIDRGLSEFAKKMPIFEPERVGGAAAEEKPLPINLELGLYRAKVLTRCFEYKEAEKILVKCIKFWPEDGRAYVALGKLFCKQSRFSEARAVYEKGCQATQGENSYIWQCWAVLESKAGNIRRARELFDAATVADKQHIAAWHGWAVLEIKQGNIKKARNLLAKGLKYCGGNEYIYQTLALLEAKSKRFEQARFLFQQATKCNPKSCASWLVSVFFYFYILTIRRCLSAWAQVELQQDNNFFARQLFEETRVSQATIKQRLKLETVTDKWDPEKRNPHVGLTVAICTTDIMTNLGFEHPL
ncbi:Protein high chlorophyll fluorescent 107, partial [Ananas comosus]